MINGRKVTSQAGDQVFIAIGADEYVVKPSTFEQYVKFAVRLRRYLFRDNSTDVGERTDEKRRRLSGSGFQKKLA